MNDQQAATKSLLVRVGVHYKHITISTIDGSEPAGESYTDAISALMLANEGGCGDVYKDGCFLDIESSIDPDKLVVPAKFARDFAIGLVARHLIEHGYSVLFEADLRGAPEKEQ